MNEVNSESLVVVCPLCGGHGLGREWCIGCQKKHCQSCHGDGYLRVMTKAEFDKRYQERHSLG